MVGTRVGAKLCVGRGVWIWEGAEEGTRDGVDDVVAAMLDEAKTPALPDTSAAPELVDVARACFAKPADRPKLDGVADRVERLLEEDYAQGADAKQRLARVQAAVTEEEKSDASAYARATRRRPARRARGGPVPLTPRSSAPSTRRGGVDGPWRPLHRVPSASGSRRT